MKEAVKEYTLQYLREFRPYKDKKWCYEDGIILTGAEYLYVTTKEIAYRDFILQYLDTSVDEEGNLSGYQEASYNIDNVNSGKVLFFALRETNHKKYEKAIIKLFQQLLHHPRTNTRSYWHKKRYPYQIWLDGLYMGQPFLAQYGRLYMDERTELEEDILTQFDNVKRYLWDSRRELYVHAYDETKSMQWADKVTGKAPNVWSRAIGWYSMALIDVLEVLSDASKIQENLSQYLSEMVQGVIQYQSSQGMWYQVVDREDVVENYLETSGTLMLAYSILKGVRLGYLEHKYLSYGISAYEGTLEKYFKKNSEGYHLGGICEVAGLDHLNRDGSVAYYLSENIATDEAKGVAPLMMCFSEILRIDSIK